MPPSRFNSMCVFMEEKQEMEVDIVDLLRSHGYGVVEGADEVRKKIQEIGNEPERNENGRGV